MDYDFYFRETSFQEGYRPILLSKGVSFDDGKATVGCLIDIQTVDSCCTSIGSYPFPDLL
jgi:hypothetical protein